jgi:hypothetical protein
MKDDEGMPYLLRFIRTFVVHLTAKRALERYYFQAKEAKISLFGVERTPLLLPAGSWPKMQAILRESLSSDPSESESSTSAGDADIAIKAIQLLQEKIETPPQNYSLRCGNLVKDFKKIIDDVPVLLPGRMHCETVLATLSKYYGNCLVIGDDNANLACTCEVLLFLHIDCSI